MTDEARRTAYRFHEAEDGPTMIDLTVYDESGTQAVKAEPTEHQRHYMTEASLIGLAPGSWPEDLTADYGEARVYLRKLSVLGAGETIAVVYAAGGLSLEVLND